METWELIWDGSDNRLLPSRSMPPIATSIASAAEEETLHGSCHCKKVTFSVRVGKQPITLLDCNCSICAKKGYLHLTVAQDRVSISQQSSDCMTTYRFGTGVARHTFCATCGVQAIYVPRSNPECYAVNARCLQLAGRVVRVVPLDGKTFTGRLTTEHGLL